MALQLATGEYVVVESATEDRVTVRFHKDANQRERYKNNTLDTYEFTKQMEYVVKVDLEGTPDTSKCICDNTITAGYNALKTLPEFVGATDLITIEVIQDGTTYWRPADKEVEIKNSKIKIKMYKYATVADAKARTNSTDSVQIEVDFDNALPTSEYIEAISTTMSLPVVEI